MKVFISWSGQFAHRPAGCVRELLHLLMPDVQTFLSSEDIEKGSRWVHALSTELDKSDFGIICLTPDSVMAPWVFFEAGALSKKFEFARIYPLLLGLSPTQLPGPLQGFNATQVEEQDLLRLLKSIKRTAGGSVTEIAAMEKVFKRRWPNFRKAIDLLTNQLPEVSGSNACPVAPRTELPALANWNVALRARDLLLIGVNLNIVLRQSPFFISMLSAGAQIRLVMMDSRESNLMNVLARGVVETGHLMPDFKAAVDTVNAIRRAVSPDKSERLLFRTINYVPTMSFRNYSAHFYKAVFDSAEPGLRWCSLEGGDQGVEDVGALLVQGRAIRADDAVGLGSSQCTKAA